jgi:hypothetical protein
MQAPLHEPPIGSLDLWVQCPRFQKQVNAKAQNKRTTTTEEYHSLGCGMLNIHWQYSQNKMTTEEYHWIGCGSLNFYYAILFFYKKFDTSKGILYCKK